MVRPQDSIDWLLGLLHNRLKNTETRNVFTREETKEPQDCYNSTQEA